MTERIENQIERELAVLTFLVVALVISLVLLRKRGVATVAERET